MKFEIFKSQENNKFYFRGKGKNGEIIFQSQGYTTKQNAEKTIEVIKNEAKDAKVEHL
ncbi:MULTISPECIES: YegP family protein [Fusobacterium]|jgi:uncharacterized protein YegP (UPF0339 family)|uniref:YegP family protein n=1 Tax=Fusobacterium hominis TaxID=2764326 RepID=A0A7G9GUY6_9FUSO|nr:MULTISPECIES: YegP family protein [Fusobacterium]QNM14618.1 YegP family protein [Fusobacterium hominis]